MQWWKKQESPCFSCGECQYHDILKEQLFFEYAHQTVGLSISMGASIGHPISGSVGIGFTGGSYDSRGFAKNYHFDKNDH